MKAPIKWLKSYVELDDITPKELEAGMTMSGSKVEGIEDVGSEITNVVVGKILSVEKHPDAEKLVVCSLDVGKDEPVQIVTGAKNVAVGDFVPVALNNSTLPNGVKIKSGKLRGVLSDGMLCSISELNITLGDAPYAIEDGILILDKEYPLGMDIKKVFDLDENVVEFEITSNRPDCLSMIGLAREAAATFSKKFTMPNMSIVNEDKNDNISNYLKVDVRDSELCKRYIARVIKDVKIAPSPEYIRNALRNAGVRPINNIVDITNYVMLEFGQPLHAFDYANLKGSTIVVRRAQNGEKITTLDQVERKLDESMLVICDEDTPTAVAGVMGGEFSGIANDTKTVVFESANFFGANVRVTAKKLGMRTESSGRFEKGLDPNLTKLAIDRACALVEELGCGTVVAGIIDASAPMKEEVRILLDDKKINKFLGTDIPKEEMKRILQTLEFRIEGDIVIPPTFRGDVETIADISEEIVRIYGYNNIPTTLFKDSTQGMLTDVQKDRKKVDTILIGQGLTEIITYTFISPKSYDKILLAENDIKRRSVTILNPLGEDTSVMRTTTLPSIMDIISLNYNHRNERGAFFENATVYIPGEDAKELPTEKKVITIGFYNNGDYYDLKGICEELLNAFGVEGYEIEAQRQNPSYHTGRCALITINGEELATLGEIHPRVLKNYSVEVPVYVAEIDFNTLCKNKKVERKYTHLPKFPAVTRDLAFVCDDSISAFQIEKIIKENGGKTLESVKLFDVYKGKQIKETQKSMAFALTLRNKEKTLNDEEVDKVIQKIMTALQRELGIILRS